MPYSLDPGASAILARLRQEEISALYHFTNVENLPNICQQEALYSKQILAQKELLSTLVTGGNPLSHDLDHYHGNWDKVSLSLTPHTPMAYNRKRAQHLCFFLVKPEVATWSGVVFTDSNAARTDHKRGPGFIGLNNIQFNVIRAIPFSVNEWHRFVQAEVLIPNSIPLTYVSEIGFVSSASLDYTELLCDRLPHPKFSVIPQLFTDSRGASPRTIGFSYVHELKVIDTRNTKNMVYLPYEEENKFSKTMSNHIMIVASVRVMTGMQARISLLDAVNYEERIVKAEQLLRSDEYQHEYRVSLKDLSPGVYLVRYYLGDICWASTGFEIVP
jgi:ssDNA thymidine ADP-ribosyltransferase, DarT